MLTTAAQPVRLRCKLFHCCMAVPARLDGSVRRWRVAPPPRAASFHASTVLQQTTNELRRDQPPGVREEVQPGRRLLGWAELHRAAQIAAWSGLCYLLPPGELPARLAAQAPTLTLVAHGRTDYTAWFVADGVVPHTSFCEAARARNSNGRVAVRNDEDEDDVCALEPTAPRRERFVFMRGVAWSAPDVDSSKLSRALMRMWPAPFPPRGPGGAGPPNPAAAGGNTAAAAAAAAPPLPPLVAHEGVAELAADLYVTLKPYLDQADDVKLPLCFAGHSLGGSLALLTMAQHQLQQRRQLQVPQQPALQQQDQLQRQQPVSCCSCYQFGSPPVLAHERGRGGAAALAALGLPADAVRSFVLEHDPVPRALLSADPTFELARRIGAVKGLLALRELLAGAGAALSPGRFLFEAVGQVHLIKWTPEGGARVVPLDADEIEAELSLFSPQQPPPLRNKEQQNQQQNQQQLGFGWSAQDDEQPGSGPGGAFVQLLSPLRGLKAWLDHHHGSYSQELEAAALVAVKDAETAAAAAAAAASSDAASKRSS